MRHPHERVWWVAVATVGLCVRLGYVAFFATRHLPLADPLSYHLLGNAIATGHGFVNPLQLAFGGRAVPTASEPPLFPLALAATSALGGHTVLWHQLLGAAIGTGTVVAVAAVGRSVAGVRAGILAGAVAAVYPPLWLNDGGVMAESLFALVIAGVLVTVYRFVRNPSTSGAATLGIATGLAVLTRVEAVLLVPLLLLPLLATGASDRRGQAGRAAAGCAAGRTAAGRVAAGRAAAGRAAAGRVAAGVCAAALVVSPWVIRNLRTFDRVTLLSTGDGTLAGANCGPAYAGPKIGLWVTSCYGDAAPGDESDANAAWRSQGLAYARQHAGRVPLVVAIRVARIWQVFGPLQDARVNRDDGRPSWMNMLALGAYAALVPFAVAGAAVLRRSKVRLLPLGALMTLATVTAATVWGAVRFRAPADVAIAVLAGVAFDRLLTRYTRSPRSELSPAPVTMGQCS